MVTNGQEANQTVFNSAFVSRTTDSNTVAKLALNRTLSGDSIPDVQLTINDHEARITQNETDISTNLNNSPNSNFSAVVDPTSTDDSTLNYLVGSHWVNTVDQTIWVAIDVTENNAVWRRIDGSGAGGGGGSTLAWKKSGSPSPVSEEIDGFAFESFDNDSMQEIYAILTVPSSFVPGSQIKLTSGQFFCASTAGNVFFKTSTALINAPTVLGSYPNTYTSTNLENTVNAVSNTINSIGDIDLTSPAGEINSIQVLPGDKLRIRLFRDNANETSSAANDARLLIDNFEPTFS